MTATITETNSVVRSIPLPSPELFDRPVVAKSATAPRKAITVLSLGAPLPVRVKPDYVGIVAGMVESTVRNLCQAFLRSSAASPEMKEMFRSKDLKVQRAGLSIFMEQQTEAAFRRNSTHGLHGAAVQAVQRDLLPSESPQRAKTPGLTPAQIAAKKAKKSAASRSLYLMSLNGSQKSQDKKEGKNGKKK